LEGVLAGIVTETSKKRDHELDFDDFDWEDAAVFGGIAGFVEESLREENRRDPSEVRDEDDFDVMDELGEAPVSLKRQLQMLAAGNPGLARYIIRRAREQNEQWALQAQARRLAMAVEKAYKRQEEEEKEGRLSSKTMNEALTRWCEYKWGDLDEKQYEEYPTLFLLEELIGEKLKVTLDYRKIDGQWEDGLVVLPKRLAKLKGKAFFHGYCEKWKKEYYFRMDRTRNITLAPETEERGTNLPP
jgi:hypothetical protein